MKPKLYTNTSFNDNALGLQIAPKNPLGTRMLRLREFGRFVEIGKRDQYEGTQMELTPFLKGQGVLKFCETKNEFRDVFFFVALNFCP